MNTIDYYNTNATSFAEGTLNADVSDLYAFFEKHLGSGASILDLGCGAGRDTKYFLEKGYKVSAVDGSEELCKIASEYSGIPVKCMLFEEMNFNEEFDGIWACASLLHAEKDNLPLIFEKIRNALKPSGVLYCSFKYGDFCGDKNGRYFTYLDENSLAEMLSSVDGLKIAETLITSDVREGREDEKWLNAIVVKE